MKLETIQPNTHPPDPNKLLFFFFKAAQTLLKEWWVYIFSNSFFKSELPPKSKFVLTTFQDVGMTSLSLANYPSPFQNIVFKKKERKDFWQTVHGFGNVPFHGCYVCIRVCCSCIVALFLNHLFLWISFRTSTAQNSWFSWFNFKEKWRAISIAHSLFVSVCLSLFPWHPPPHIHTHALTHTHTHTHTQPHTVCQPLFCWWRLADHLEEVKVTGLHTAKMHKHRISVSRCFVHHLLPVIPTHWAAHCKDAL